MIDLVVTAVKQFAACPTTFFGIPPWYQYAANPSCDGITTNFALGDVWGIALGVLEILLRLSGYVAVGFIIYGSVALMASQGNPENIAKARGTILNAVIGLVLVISATTIVTFIAGKF